MKDKLKKFADEHPAIANAAGYVVGGLVGTSLLVYMSYMNEVESADHLTREEDGREMIVLYKRNGTQRVLSKRPQVES